MVKSMRKLLRWIFCWIFRDELEKVFQAAEDTVKMQEQLRCAVDLHIKENSWCVICIPSAKPDGADVVKFFEFPNNYTALSIRDQLRKICKRQIVVDTPPMIRHHIKRDFNPDFM